MALRDNLVDAMNINSLEDVKDDGLALDSAILADNDQLVSGLDANLCIVAQFLSEGHVDFPVMQ